MRIYNDKECRNMSYFITVIYVDMSEIVTEYHDWKSVQKAISEFNSPSIVKAILINVGE